MFKEFEPRLDAVQQWLVPLEITVFPRFEPALSWNRLLAVQIIKVRPQIIFFRKFLSYESTSIKCKKPS